ncbi:MAG TPA: hypothetical protein VEH04_00660 [Verrucomicrobiae bacterium]|nr:hypothetical protein [Verrucomicrobiae bacterium]
MQRDWPGKQDDVRIGALVFHEPTQSLGVLVSEKLSPIFREPKAVLQLADGSTVEVDRVLVKPANEEQHTSFFSNPEAHHIHIPENPSSNPAERKPGTH